MDPTKNFDHLDPKLKETYARVMGTTPATPAQDPAAQSAATQQAAPGMNAPFPSAPVIPAPMPAAPYPGQGMEPNPGTGPTVSSIPQETSTVVPQMQQPQQAPNTPMGSSFFSNPSPATAAPTQNPVSPGGAPFAPPADAGQAPVTPYAPDGQMPNPMPVDQMGQPLPAPAAAVQQGPRETSPLLRVLYIIGGVIFFAIYTVFWIKVFNLPFFF